MTDFHKIVPGAEFYGEMAEAMRGTVIEEGDVRKVAVEMLRANGQVIVFTMDPDHARQVADGIRSTADAVERHRRGQ